MSTAMTGTSRVAPTWVIVALSVILAASIGWIDYHADEVQPAVLLLLVSAAMLAYANPSRAWLVALLLGLSIAATHVVASTAGLKPVSPTDSPLSTLLALIPASMGVACGAAARVMWSRGHRA